MCLCTVYGSHRVHLFKNQKHLFSLSSRFFAKTINYKKKKKSVPAVHSEAVTPVSLHAAAFSPRHLRRGSCIPKVEQSRLFQQVISAHLALSSTRRNGDTPHVWYQVLKLFTLFPSPRGSHHSTKQSLLPVVV